MPEVYIFTRYSVQCIGADRKLDRIGSAIRTAQVEWNVESEPIFLWIAECNAARKNMIGHKPVRTFAYSIR
jgi:hypothetical protein